MSILPSSFLEVPLKQLNEAYYEQIVPKLTKKNKAVAVVAVAFLVVFSKLNTLLRPPRKLRHIPYQGFFSYLVSLAKDKSILQRSQRYGLPKVDSEENNGIYLRTGRFGWEAQISNPEAIKRVLLKHEFFPKVNADFKVKSAMIFKFVGDSNIACVNGHHWKKQRKIANPAFHRAMPVLMFGKLTKDLFKEMDKLGPAIEVTDLMERWTLDAIGKAGFDFDFNAITDKDNAWVKTYNSFREAISHPIFFLFPILESHFLWMFPKRKQAHADLDHFLSMMRTIIVEKRKKIESNQNQNANLNENERDLLNLMLESEMKGEGQMTNKELENNLSVFFLAGHDTTSNALSFAIYYLAQNQEIQQRAREEAISILGDKPEDVLPTIEDTKKMEYIYQIMKETLRINGPAPNVVTRVATDDCELAGIFIPKGTLLNVNIFETHNSEKNWTNPLKFDPDRFASDLNGNDISVKGMNWVPFGNGARQCIGMNFSINEQKVMLSMLLRKYSWCLPIDSIHTNGIKTTGIEVVAPYDLKIEFTRNY
ncbi:cytochrome P450 [Backusella circina FSU 941]|nr:cytochrome P450 [Backusella circina FSU 941]